MMHEKLWNEVSRAIDERMGLDYSRKKTQKMRQVFSWAARDFGFSSPEACAEWFLTTPYSNDLMDKMAGYLTIKETYFYREHESLDILRNVLIPNFVANRKGRPKRLRVWSAGCSTGEEAYTIAIVLLQQQHLLHSYDVTILATDINPKSLQKGKEGIYTEWSFRGTPDWFKKNYFVKVSEGTYQVKSHVKEMVDFRYMNLVKDNYPSLMNDTNAMDLIFCRNVLMYMKQTRAQQVVNKFRKSLIEGGYLMVSATETSMMLFEDLKMHHYPGMICYEKQLQGVERATKKADQHKVVKDLILRDSLKKSYGSQKESTLVQKTTAFDMDPYYKPREPNYEDLYESQVLPSEKQMEEDALEESIVRLETVCRELADQGKLEEALKKVDQALELERLNARLYYLRAAILQEMECIESAIQALRKATYLEHDMVVAHFVLGNLYMHQGDTSKSRKSYDNALKLLDQYGVDELVPESDGLSAKRFKEIIRTTLKLEN